MKLYEVSKNIELATSMVDEDGCITEEGLALLDTAENTLTEKADSIGVILQEKDNKIDSIKKEIERLTEWKKREEKQKEQLKEYLAKNILELSPDGIQGNKFRFSFRKSESVLVECDEFIPEEFIKTKVSTTIDKTELKKALKNGQEIQGVILETKNNLQIN